MKITLKKKIKRFPVSLAGYSYTLQIGEEVFPVNMEEKNGSVLVSDRSDPKQRISDDIFSIKKDFLEIVE